MTTSYFTKHDIFYRLPAIVIMFSSFLFAYHLIFRTVQNCQSDISILGFAGRSEWVFIAAMFVGGFILLGSPFIIKIVGAIKN